MINLKYYNYKSYYKYYLIISNKLIHLFFLLKYFLYFVSFINILLINLIYYSFFNKSTTFLVEKLYFTINLNGCVLIKFIQWSLDNFNFLFDDNDISDKKIHLLNLFNNLYENCEIHNINYTKKIYNQEFNTSFDNDIEIDKNYEIKSGSVAQIYKAKFINNPSKDIAIKVVHPEIQYQLIYPMLFIKILRFIISNVWFLKKYNIIFNFESFFQNIKLQKNMNNEFNNLKYYYNIYNNNSHILIPQPLYSSDNILIMEYYNGYTIDEIDISQIEKQKIIILLNLFIKNNYMFLDYIHNDLHKANWKIINHDNIYKIIIYDFGYVIKNNMQNIYKNLSYYVDLNDYTKISEILYHNISNIDISEIEFTNCFINYINNSNIIKAYDSNTLKLIYKFCYINKYILRDILLEIFISLLLFKKNMDTYLFFEDYDINYIVQLNFYYYEYCEKNKIFNDVKNYIHKYYINNDTIKKLYKYNNNYFDTLSGNNDQSIKYDADTEITVNIDI